MDDASCREYFTTAKSTTYHRQYEALRSVFVEGRSQMEVAREFGYSYGSFRQLVLEFRCSMREGFADANGESPFFESPHSAGRRRRQKPEPPRSKSRPIQRRP